MTENYYLATNFEENILEMTFPYEEDAKAYGAKKVKELNKIDKEKKHMYGYKVKYNAKNKNYECYIQSCDLLSEKNSLKVFDEFTINPENMERFGKRIIALVYKNNKGLKTKPIITESNVALISPLYLENMLASRCGEKQEIDTRFLIELTKKYRNYYHLSSHIEFINYLTRNINSGQVDRFKLCDAVFNFFYDLIQGGKLDSKYIDRKGNTVYYSYNVMREFGFFYRDYVRFYEPYNNNNVSLPSSQKPMVLKKTRDDYHQISMAELLKRKNGVE